MPLPRFLGHPDDLCEQWMAETWENDADCSWDREDMMSAYREGRDEARRQLAPKWDALAAERDAAREQLATCRERNAAIAVQLDQYRDERDRYRVALERIRRGGLSLTELAYIAQEALEARP